MDIEKLFDEKSEIYASSRPRYPSSLYEWLVRQCQNQQVVWDVGCGNGQAAISLQGYFESVHATDISTSQIANSPAYENVTFSVQPAEATNFSDQFFDAVCVAQALHWFEFDRFWPEVQRVLKTGGIFTAWGYVWPQIDSSITVLLEESFLSVIRPYWAEQNKLLWDGYKNVAMPFTQLEPPEITMSIDWSVEQFFSYLHSWSVTRVCMKS